jgi:putative dehydrogenase
LANSFDHEPPRRDAAVAVVGLGIMGGAIAGHLVRAGYEVHGLDPDPDASGRAQAAGVHVLASVAAIPPEATIIVSSLPTEQALEELVLRLITRRPAEALLAETSTLSLAAKERARATLAVAGIAMMDCPISGTGAQAATADLSVYASGDEACWLRLEPVLRAFANRPVHVGAFGAGTHLKIAANLLVAIHNVAAAEAMQIVLAAGIDPSLATRVLGEGAGGSRMFELRAPLMAQSAYEPATMKLDVWRKDMELISTYLSDRGLNAPAFLATRPLYEKAAQRRPLEDTAAVYEQLRSGG